MNSTIEKFGYPATLIREYRHWLVLLRPQQVTIGSLVLAAKSDVEAFGSLPTEAFAELKVVTSDIERALGSAVTFEKINYLMLMMVDPHVHFHVFPRHGGVRALGGVELRDSGWPGQPMLADALKLTPAQIDDIARRLRESFG